MAKVTFQVVEGVDRGRVFRNLPTPITIGREEGNMLRLNDERVSRYHAKVQCDNDEIILTDLDSTNGTRVNGAIVQLRRLRVCDRISIGRSVLLFGSEAEIQESIAAQKSSTGSAIRSRAQALPASGRDVTIAGESDENAWEGEDDARTDNTPSMAD